MGALLSLLIILILSIFVTRVATVALAQTGLSRQAARFQARSAFTGVGFTTRESEMVVRHPVRRRIVMLVMLLGNVGIVSAISSLMLTFVDNQTTQSVVIRVVLIGVGVGVLWILASSKVIDRFLLRLIGRALERKTDLDVRDYDDLLHLAGDYRVTEISVEEDDWIADRKLRECEIAGEGILVLGIKRADGTYIGAPQADTRIKPGDTLVMYGRSAALERLGKRRHGTSGDRDHDEAISEQQDVVRRQKEEDPEAD